MTLYKPSSEGFFMRVAGVAVGLGHVPQEGHDLPHGLQSSLDWEAGCERWLLN